MSAECGDLHPRLRAEPRVQGVRNAARGMNTAIALLTFIAIVFLAGFLPTAAFGAEKWQGVDETVVEKIAKEHGRAAKEPLFNTDNGDLLLFVFLLAGAIGGFAAGYYWRSLTEKKQD